MLRTTRLPAYLYNYSVHTGNVISVESYKKLSQQLPHLRGIKCTVTAMSDATPYKEAMPHLQVSAHSAFLLLLHHSRLLRQHATKLQVEPATVTLQAYLGGIEGQALEGLQKGLDGVIAGGEEAWPCGPCQQAAAQKQNMHPHLQWYICTQQWLQRCSAFCAGMSAVLPNLVAKVDAEFRKGNLEAAEAAQETLNKWYAHVHCSC